MNFLEVRCRFSLSEAKLIQFTLRSKSFVKLRKQLFYIFFIIFFGFLVAFLKIKR